jgi:hypothetical protein
MNHSIFKDEQLDQLAELGNVAQFVSFAPNCDQRFARILGESPNATHDGTEDAIRSLLSASRDKRINIRSFKPEMRQGNEFIYGIDDAGTALSAVNRLAASGMFVIANETIDVNDGGVSGVAQGGLFEFAPGATPRIVETGAVATLHEAQAIRILSGVYKVPPAVPKEHDLRVEFSIHPHKCGVRRTNTILWEAEETDIDNLDAPLRWPNLFSELVGDKAFGLLVADAFGYSVPHTTVICRKIPPFTFGTHTGEDTLWMRTAPKQADPGFFPTVRGWTDPFKIMEDSTESSQLASLLIQDEVKAKYSGALISASGGGCLIEGVKGFGDEFMLGKSGPSELPIKIRERLSAFHEDVQSKLGGVRIEWAFDGSEIWVLQLQQIEAMSVGRSIVPGKAEREIAFDVSEGLAALRALLNTIKGENSGICLVGNVGITSHFADVLRRSGIPSRIEAAHSQHNKNTAELIRYSIT